MFNETCQDWVLTAMTHPGAKQITMLVAVGAYLSTHMLEEGLVGPGDGGAVHALTLS